jgi:lysophospholipase L1-like esterase
MKIWVAGFVLLGAGLAQAQATKPTSSSDPTRPAIKLDKDGKPQKRFMELHEKFVERARGGDVDVLFLGDSITQGWSQHKEIWEASFNQYKAANFGIGGDRTQHVLWRIENGELEGIKPKVVVLLIGTNNTSSDPLERIAAGVEKIVQTVRDKTGAKVLLLGVFPREDGKGDKAKTAMHREKIGKVNERIAKLDDGGKTVRYLDLKDEFLEADGSISETIMPDKLHLSKEGYQRWADGIKDVLAEMMK